MTIHDPSLRAALKTLKLTGMLDTLDARLAQTRDGKLGHLEFLQVLCEDEIGRRESAALARRIRRARFEQPNTFDDFDFTVSPKLPAAMLRDLAALPWVWFHERCPFVAMAEKLLAEEGQEVKTAAVINDEHTIRALVASGKGLSLLREDLAAKSPLGEELAVWPGGAIGLPVNLVALTRRLGEPEVKALLDAAAKVYGVEEATAAA